MALNIAFDGYLEWPAGTPVAAYYQAYFLKVNGSSSPSTWNTVAQASSPTGYFNFNLGDGDFLGQDGVAADGDVVVIAAWIGGGADRSGLLSISNLAFLPITLSGGASTYTGQSNTWIRVLDLQDPIADINGLADSLERLESDTFSNRCRMEHSSAAGGYPTVYQNQFYPNQVAKTVEVFPELAIGVTYIDFEFGESDNDLQSFLSSFYGDTYYNLSHSWDEVGLHTIRVTCQTELGFVQSANLSDAITDTIVIYSRSPTPDLSWAPLSATQPTINDLITFTPNITDPDSVVDHVDYYIDGESSPTETGLAVGETWQYQFATNGNHTVRQVVYYDNGVDSAFASVEDTFTVNVRNIDPVAAWTAGTEAVSATKYSWDGSGSSDEDGVIANYSWDLDYDTGSAGYENEASMSGAGASSFSYTFSTEGQYRLRLTVTDDDGGTDTKEEIFSVSIVATGGGVNNVVIKPIGVKGIIS